jgi:predicted nuclease with TOPRIM domain
MSAPCKFCKSNAHNFGYFCDCYEVVESPYIKKLEAENAALRSRITKLEKENKELKDKYDSLNETLLEMHIFGEDI